MIKVYFDWNVLSQMKNGHHSELLSYIEGNDKFLIPYSTVHIGDISSSFNNTEHNKYIDIDLEFISRISNNYCLYHNGKGITIDYYPAKELFENQMKDKKPPYFTVAHYGEDKTEIKPKDSEAVIEL